ncbi:MAG: restriction endonuclease subunit R [Gammaproteobacteria bacterium]|nr:restriction endonuclease subunit R [Gammaproteobacteria bacterium]
MGKIPAKVQERIVTGIKRFQPILSAAKARDVGESDTVTIITDMLAEIFGYDKYSEITSEHAIRGTFCDLATKIDGQLSMLFEVKAIGLDLKDSHVKQAVDYAANQGTEWVVLTNGVIWRVYKVTFSKPINNELVIEIDFISLNHKNAKDLESMYLFCKEGWIKSVLGEFHSQKQALSKFFLSAVVLSEGVLQVIRRELKRLSPDLKVETDEIKAALIADVLKREVTEGEEAEAARRKASRASGVALRTKKSAGDNEAVANDTPSETPESPPTE